MTSQARVMIREGITPLVVEKNRGFWGSRRVFRGGPDGWRPLEGSASGAGAGDDSVTPLSSWVLVMASP